MNEYENVWMDRCDYELKGEFNWGLMKDFEYFEDDVVKIVCVLTYLTPNYYWILNFGACGWPI